MSEETDPAATPKTHRKLSEADWAEARGLYETGRLNKTELSEKYGISRQSIHDGLKARGAVWGSRSKVIEDAVVEAQKDAAAKRLDDIAAMKERQRQRVEVIQNLAIQQITEQIRNKKPIADRKNDMVTLKAAMSIIQAGRSELYQIFDLIRDPAGADEIPEFIVGEYTADEIDALNRQRLGVVDEDLAAVAATVLTDTGADPLDDLLDDEES